MTLRTLKKMIALKIMSRTTDCSLQDSDDTNAKPCNSEDELGVKASEATL